MIEGKNVILRQIREDDLDEVLEQENTYAKLGEHNPVNFRSEPAFRSHFAETGCWEEHLGRMLITTKDGRILGQILFYTEPWYNTALEIGFGIYDDEDRGRGFVTEAVRIFSAYLFALRPVPRIQMVTSADNLAAQRVAEKCGFMKEGVLRQAYFARGRYHDCAMHSLLRDECPTLDEVLAG